MLWATLGLLRCLKHVSDPKVSSNVQRSPLVTLFSLSRCVAAWQQSRIIPACRTVRTRAGIPIMRTKALAKKKKKKKGAPLRRKIRTPPPHMYHVKRHLHIYCVFYICWSLTATVYLLFAASALLAYTNFSGKSPSFCILILTAFLCASRPSTWATLITALPILSRPSGVTFWEVMNFWKVEVLTPLYCLA